MGSPARSSTTWKFEDIEPKLRSYAENLNLTYDAKHPFSCLPEDSAKRALELLGSNIHKAAKHLGYSYSTVAGWFRPGRNPSRRTVAECIYPALCEAFITHYAEWTPTTVYNPLFNLDDNDHALYDALAHDEEFSSTERKALSKRIFILLSTGEVVTPRDAEGEYQETCEKYRRATMRYGASLLNGDDLVAASQIVQALLAARFTRVTAHLDSKEVANSTCRNPLGQRGEMLFANEKVHVQLNNLTPLEGTPTERTRSATQFMRDCTDAMNESVIQTMLLTTDDATLASIRDDINLELEMRAAEL